MDGYRLGMNGKQAAWASKKYRGHQVLPESIMRELDVAHSVVMDPGQTQSVNKVKSMG